MTEFPEEQINSLVRQKLEGQSYSEIKAELRKSGMPDDEISTLIRQVDKIVLEKEMNSAAPNQAKRWYRAGLLTAIAGLVLTLAYSAGLLLTSLPPMVIYSPFLLGILLMLFGKRFAKNKAGAKEKGTGSIRRQRPFK